MIVYQYDTCNMINAFYGMIVLLFSDMSLCCNVWLDLLKEVLSISIYGKCHQRSIYSLWEINFVELLLVLDRRKVLNYELTPI